MAVAGHQHRTVGFDDRVPGDADVLRREHSGLLRLVILHAGMKVIELFWIEGQGMSDWPWTCLLVGAIAVHGILSSLKNRTELLSARGL